MNVKDMRPMLAATLKDIDTLRYPVYCTPKLDGIRCMVIDGKAYTRKLKTIPNEHIQIRLEDVPINTDGELIVGKTFQSTSSAVMSHEGTPQFIYCVFDILSSTNYLDRIDRLKHTLMPGFVNNVIPSQIDNKKMLLEYESWELGRGYEGIIIRADVHYKHGRSTLREQGMLKLKRFSDSEATVYGYEPLKHNTNIQKTDELGYAKRSHHKINMIEEKAIGAFLVRDLKTGVEFKVSTGLTSGQRVQLWKIGHTLIGKIIKYKYQPTGVKDKPRFPVFLGFRDGRDL